MNPHWKILSGSIEAKKAKPGDEAAGRIKEAAT
jgi:hypothetical protein